MSHKWLVRKSGETFHYFSLVIKFSKQFKTNWFPYVQKLWDINSKLNSKYHLWCVENKYHPSSEFVFGIIIILLITFIALPVLSAWAFIKTIKNI